MDEDSNNVVDAVVSNADVDLQEKAPVAASATTATATTAMEATSPSSSEQTEQQPTLTDRQIKARARRANRSSGNTGVVRPGAVSVPADVTAAVVEDSSVPASSSGNMGNLDGAVEDESKPAPLPSSPAVASTADVSLTTTVAGAAEAEPPTPLLSTTVIKTPTKKLSIEEQDKIAKRRAVSGIVSSAGVATAAAIAPPPVAAAVRPGAVSVQTIDMVVDDVPPSIVEPSSVATPTSASLSSNTGPTKKMSQREEEDMRAKRRARSGRATSVVAPGAVAAVSTTTTSPDVVRPGAVSVKPNEQDESTIITADVTVASAVEPPTAAGPAVGTAPKQLSQREEDARAKSRAAGRTSNGGRRTTVLPGAVAVVEPSEPDMEEMKKKTTTAATTTTTSSPSSSSPSKENKLSQQEQDIRAKNRGRRSGGVTESTQVRPGAVAVQASEPTNEKQESVSTIDKNRSQEQQDLDAKNRPSAGRAAAINYVLQEPSAPDVVECSVDAPTPSTGFTEEENDAATKRSLRSSSAIQPGAVAVKESNQEEPLKVPSDQKSHVQSDAALKSHLQSGSSSNEMAVPGAVAVVAEEDGDQTTVTASSTSAVISQSQQDAIAKSRAQRPSRRTASRVGGDGGGSNRGLDVSASTIPGASSSSISSSDPVTSSSVSQVESDAQIKARARSSQQRSIAAQGPAVVEVTVESSTSVANLSTSVHSMSSSMHNSMSSMDGSSAGLDELARRREQRAAARANRRLQGSQHGGSQHGSTPTPSAVGASSSSSFSGMSEDERQRRYDAKMAQMEQGHQRTLEQRSTGGLDASTTSTSQTDSTTTSASSARASSQSSSVFSGMSERERQRRYDEKMAQMEQSHEDARDKRGNGSIDVVSSNGGAPVPTHHVSPKQGNSDILDSKAFTVTSPSQEMGSKAFSLGGHVDPEQPLLPPPPPIAVADYGRTVAPEVQYGEYQPGQYRRPSDVLDNELAVAVAINEDEEEYEKESLVAAHAVEYDPDSKPPIYLNRRFRLYTIFACVILLVVLVIIIAVSVSSSGGGGGQQEIQYLTNAPTSTPTPAPTTARESIYRNYFAEELGQDELVVGTAEYMAAEWILNEDPAALDVDSSRLVQRFMLAFLYFQTTALGTRQWKSCNPPSGDEDDTCVFLEFDRQPDGSVIYNEVNDRVRWLSAAPECQWSGVLCGGGTDVVGIRLVGQELSGTLPTQLGAIPFLQVLQFHFNEFTGTIPPDYAGFRHLLALEVHGNLLSGTIPTAFFEQDVTELITLNVGDNLLSGTLDTRVGQLTDLKGLHVFGNNLVGPLPSEIGQLPYLTYSRIYGNEFTGTLPSELGRPPQFIEFWYNDNQFTGTIPSELGRLRRMQDFRISGNQLTGTIPPELFGMTKAVIISMGENSLRGPLPATELLQMTDLIQLRVSRNQLSGPIPTELGAMPSLRLAHLHLNLFTGEVPLDVCAANVPNGLNFLQADCAPVEDPPNPCRCCSACCDRSTEICLRVE